MKFDLKNALIKIKDAGANEVTMKIGDGTLTTSEKRAIEYVKDRGILDMAREGDEQEMDVRFDLVLEFLYSTGAPVTPYEALKKINTASTWVTTGADVCAPYAVDIEVTHTPPCAAVGSETVTIEEFRYESIDVDFKAGTMSVTGKANRTAPVIVRTPAV